MALTLRELAFVDAYVGPAEGNASKAAELAGYRSRSRAALRVMGCVILKRPDVRKAIADALYARGAHPRRVLGTLMRQMEGDIMDIATIDPQTKLVSIDLARAAWLKKTRIIKRLRVRTETTTDANSGATTTAQTVDVELYDAQAAAEKLARILGMVVDRAEIETRQSPPRRSLDEWSALAEQWEREGFPVPPAIQAYRQRKQLPNVVSGTVVVSHPPVEQGSGPVQVQSQSSGTDAGSQPVSADRPAPVEAEEVQEGDDAADDMADEDFEAGIESRPEVEFEDDEPAPDCTPAGHDEPVKPAQAGGRTEPWQS